MQAINSTTQLPEAKHTESHLLADKERRQMVRINEKRKKKESYFKNSFKEISLLLFISHIKLDEKKKTQSKKKNDFFISSFIFFLLIF